MRTKEKTSKQMKRVLVSFLDSCQDSDLERFYLILGLQSNIADKLGDKYMVYILLKFLSRGFHPAERDLIIALKTQLPAMVRSKNFKFMLDKLNQTDRSPIKTTIKEIVFGQLSSPTSHRTSDVSQADLTPPCQQVTSIWGSFKRITTNHIECPDLTHQLCRSAVYISCISTQGSNSTRWSYIKL